jgi:CRISPR-associated endoribonuclease Cas6
MLIRSTWTLKVAEPTTLPRSYGLEVVKHLHQRLGIEMGSEQIPSTACSGILGSVSTSGDFVTFHLEEFYQLSLCGLREESSKAIADLQPGIITAESIATLKLLGASFHILNREDDITSYEQLYHTLVATEPEPIKRFDLKFSTPTSFAQNRLHLPLPVPALMFRSWLERWNHFAPVYLGSDDLIEYLATTVAVTRHYIQTQRFTVHSGKVSGFTGSVSLQILSAADPLIASVTNLLIEYARFAGTGMKTRLGMGQTQLKKPGLALPCDRAHDAMMNQ